MTIKMPVRKFSSLSRSRPSLLQVLLCSLLALTIAGCDKARLRDDRPDQWPVERLYNEAKQSLADKEWEQAIEYYKLLESKFPYGQYAEQAQLELAYAHYKDGERELASAEIERFLQVHPTHPKVDYAHYLRGLVYYNEDDSFFGRVSGRDDLSDRDPQNARQAFTAFRDLVTRFPESRYTTDARRRMAHLLNSLATHDVRVADYYLRRGAWVAVVNRAKYVIENYEQTPAVEQALGLMGIAYKEMGMSDLVKDTRDVLKANFPSSEYLEQLN